MPGVELLFPDWPAPSTVKAVSTTRLGGVSAAPFDSLNLGAHVGDEQASVDENRKRLAETAGVPGPVQWLSQVHGTRVCDLDVDSNLEADAAKSRRAGTACGVLTADCVPVLFCDRAGSVVAAAHAGWRGLAGGMLEATVSALSLPPGELLAWLGPGIGPSAFEVGDDVRRAFTDCDPASAGEFTVRSEGRWMADLYGLSRRRLHALGVSEVFGGNHCTHSEPGLFYSYRRDGRCGRMATLVWLE